MFFEWPTELRGALPSYSRIRLQIEGAQGRKDIYILESNNTQEPGQGTIGGARMKIFSNEAVDLIPNCRT
jgi:hypothetical protein